MKLLSILVILGLASLGSAQVTQSHGGYLFRARLAKGQKITWSMTGRKVAAKPGPGSDAKFDLVCPFVMTVSNVKNGVADVHTVEGPTKMNGKQIVEAGYGDGQLTSRLMPPAGSPGTAGAFTGMYPERAIKLHESWTCPIQLSTGGFIGHMAATYRLDGFKVLNGVKVAILATTITGNIDGHGTTTVRVSDGIPEKMSINVGITYQQPDMGNAVDLRLLLELIRK